VRVVMAGPTLLLVRPTAPRGLEGTEQRWLFAGVGCILNPFFSNPSLCRTGPAHSVVFVVTAQRADTARTDESPRWCETDTLDRRT